MAAQGRSNRADIVRVNDTDEKAECFSGRMTLVAGQGHEPITKVQLTARHVEILSTTPRGLKRKPEALLTLSRLAHGLLTLLHQGTNDQDANHHDGEKEL
jgi:hypothetical protein